MSSEGATPNSRAGGLRLDCFRTTKGGPGSGRGEGQNLPRSRGEILQGRACRTACEQKQLPWGVTGHCRLQRVRGEFQRAQERQGVWQVLETRQVKVQYAEGPPEGTQETRAGDCFQKAWQKSHSAEISCASCLRPELFLWVGVGWKGLKWRWHGIDREPESLQMTACSHP